MQLMVSRSYPAIDAETLTEYSARDALFRADADHSSCTWRQNGSP
jgi:hypothetical protein